MERLLTLNTDNFITGYSPYGEFLQRGGLFTSAPGINVFNSTYWGAIAATEELTQIGDGTVVDSPQAGVVHNVDASTSYAYLLGSSGHFYRVALTASTVSDLRSGTPITNPANGIAIFQATGGTKYLYYWQKTQIGRWDLSGTYATGWTDNQFTGLTDTVYHKTHNFLRGVWYCNGDKIGSIVDDGAAGVTHSTNVLDFPSTHTATDITDDGFYLAVALNEISGEGIYESSPKIIFWNTFSSSWQREWRVPSRVVNSIRSIGRLIYITTDIGVFVCSYDEPPQLVFRYGNNVSGPGSGSGSQLVASATATLFNGILFRSTVGASTVLAYYGSISAGVSPSFFTPTKLVGVTDLVLKFSNTQFLVGDAINNDLYVCIPVNLDTSVSTTFTAETKYIDLKGRWDIKRIDLLFAEPLSSGDAVNIDVQKDEDTSAVDWGTASFTLNGAKQRVSLRNGAGAGNNAEYLKLILNITGGNPRIVGISVWGDKRTE